MSNKENAKKGPSKKNFKKVSAPKKSNIIGGSPWLTPQEGSQNTFYGPDDLEDEISLEDTGMKRSLATLENETVLPTKGRTGKRLKPANLYETPSTSANSSIQNCKEPTAGPSGLYAQTTQDESGESQSLIDSQLEHSDNVMSKKVTIVVDATNPNLQDTETSFFDNSQSIDFGEVEEFVEGVDGQLYVKKGQSLVAVRVMNEVEYGKISQQKDTIGIPVGSGAASGQESFASGDEEDHEEDMVEGDNVSTNESVTESSVEVTDELKLLLQKIIKKTFKHHLVVHLKLKERQTEVPRKMLDLFYKRLLLNLRSDLMEKGIQPLETDYLLYVRSYLATTYSNWAGYKDQYGYPMDTIYRDFHYLRMRKGNSNYYSNKKSKERRKTSESSQMRTTKNNKTASNPVKVRGDYGVLTGPPNSNHISERERREFQDIMDKIRKSTFNDKKLADLVADTWENTRAITNETDFTELSNLFSRDLLPHLTRFYYYKAYIARILQRPETILEIFRSKLEDFMLVIERMADHFNLKFPFPPHVFEFQPYIGCVRMIAAMFGESQQFLKYVDDTSQDPVDFSSVGVNNKMPTTIIGYTSDNVSKYAIYCQGSILQKDLDELSAVFVYATCPDCFWYNPAKVPKASGLKTTNTIAYLRIYFLSVADFTTNNQKLYQFGTAQTQFTEVSREEKDHKNYSFKEKVEMAMKAFKGGYPHKKPVINNDSDDEDTN